MVQHLKKYFPRLVFLVCIQTNSNIKMSNLRLYRELPAVTFFFFFWATNSYEKQLPCDLSSLCGDDTQTDKLSKI